LEAGIPSQGSTDFPWLLGYLNRSAMFAVSSAITRVGGLGLTPTDWMLNQTISVEQALQLLTIDAAYGTFQETIKGSIKAGKFADLVILSDNPLTVPENTLADIKILKTMVGGVVEYTAPGYQPMSSTNVTAGSVIHLVYYASPQFLSSSRPRTQQPTRPSSPV
ncbi:MAG: amidohydrolase family protein, partial [Candidatus Thorarchaeota archaeon]